MNYLAHAFLSFGKPEILTGNMIADFVKGKRQYTFATGIQQGIALHRAIDAFTDSHEATREAKKNFIPACGRYSGAFMDVVYDHFLARDTQYFSQASLKDFAQKTYNAIRPFELDLPERFLDAFGYMQRQDWLSGYYFKEGIFKAFRGIRFRAKYFPNGGDVNAIFGKHYSLFQRYYTQFMPDLITFSSKYLTALKI